MRYRWRDLPALASTPVGRAQFQKAGLRSLWPVLSRVARLHRSTRARRCRVVAVVGTFGKTTTTCAISEGLGLGPRTQRGNFYERIAAHILSIRPEDQYAVVEAGITHPGQMRQYARVIRPDVAVVTSIGNSHQDRLHTLENTAREKGFMVKALPDDGLAVLNGDDPYAMAMAAWTEARVVTFGLGPDNDIRGADVRVDPPDRTRFTLHLNGTTREVILRLLGEPGVYSALAAIAVGWAEGRPIDGILEALSEMPPETGRMEVRRLSGGVLLLRDDQKSSVESVHAALEVLERMPARRRVVVLHQPVDEMKPDAVAFPPLGAHLAGIADRLFFVGTSERFRHLVAGAGSPPPAGDAWVGLDLDVLGVIDRLQSTLQEGDALLLKGPGTARLDRIIMALDGRTVRCRAVSCDARFQCPDCPMAEPGWGNRRIVI